jgi:hypothetical protein
MTDPSSIPDGQYAHYGRVAGCRFDSDNPEHR